MKKDKEKSVTKRKTPLHKHWRDYTDQEIMQIKEEVCVKNRCPYLSRIYSAQSLYKESGSVSHYNSVLTCNYILITEHMRGCRPELCEHYKDKNVKSLAQKVNYASN